MRSTQREIKGRLSQLHANVLAWLRQKIVVRVLTHERFGQTLQMVAAISLLVVANFSWYSPSQAGAAGTTNMFLFWDPANALPNCWSVYSAGNGYFPYGDSAATFNTQTNVAGRPYTPTASTISTSLASLSADNVGNQPVSSYIHTHPSSPLVTFGADTSSDPANPDIAAFRSYQLIEYNVNFLTESAGTNIGCNGTGVATTIPRIGRR